ncbi:MAG: hypothetical protein HN578_10415, partial [Rhodospirillales bacterium]|nr:hypothetical protein [Rhodospirillales bacterium]
PPTAPTAVLMRPNSSRTKKNSIEPEGHRWAKYTVDPALLTPGETYTVNMKLIAQPLPAYFLFVSSAPGFDFNLSLREIAKRIVDISINLWETTKTVTIEK